MIQRDTATVHGHGIATGWTPEDLRRKTELEQELIAAGFAGHELEAEALKRLERDYGITPFHRAESDNTFTTAGVTLVALAVTGGSYTALNNASAALGVGDSSAAFAVGQTNLQGAVNVTNRIRKAMDTTFPTLNAGAATFRSTFSTGDANWTWQEWAVFSSVTDGAGTMMNRSVANIGTKTSAAAFQLLVSLTWS